MVFLTKTPLRCCELNEMIKTLRAMIPNPLGHDDDVNAKGLSHPDSLSFHLLRDFTGVKIVPSDPAPVTHAAEDAPLGFPQP